MAKGSLDISLYVVISFIRVALHLSRCKSREDQMRQKIAFKKDIVQVLSGVWDFEEVRCQIFFLLNYPARLLTFKDGKGSKEVIKCEVGKNCGDVWLLSDRHSKIACIQQKLGDQVQFSKNLLSLMPPGICCSLWSSGL